MISAIRSGSLEWLAEWYWQQCDGDWEEEHGVVVETLDNPGWMISIDLAGTGLEGRTLHQERTERGDDDWVSASSDGVTFRGAGGPRNLPELVERFRAWVTQP